MASLNANARDLVTSLINTIATTTPPNQEPSNNPLTSLSAEGHSILLTLYTLFEKELLPALDLLDRNLLTRLKVADSSLPSIYIVRSAQQHNHRSSNYEHVNHYEVRLKAWSCSCPAFTFSAFPASVSSESASEVDTRPQLENVSHSSWRFGGLTRGDGMAICKHLLACVLVEQSSVFAHCVEEREVSAEELAGWAAGWGD